MIWICPGRALGEQGKAAVAAVPEFASRLVHAGIGEALISWFEGVRLRLDNACAPALS